MSRIATTLALGLLLAGCVAPAPPLHSDLTPGEAATAASLVQQTLETAADGIRREWSSAAGGRSGWVRPVRTFIAADGRICRDYEEMLSSGGRTATYRDTACRDVGRRWVPA